MGYFSDLSRNMSKWIKLDNGESIEAEWTGVGKPVTTQFGDGVEFQFIVNDVIKPITFNNSAIVKQFDNYQKGDILIIKRNEKDIKPAYVVSKRGEEAGF